MIKIKNITLYYIEMKLNSPFVTSFGSVDNRGSILVQMEDTEGVLGFGECVAFDSPFYTEETLTTCMHVMEKFLIPLVLKNKFNHPDEVLDLLSCIRKNNMAKASIEGAIWDIYVKKKNLPLYKAIGGVREKIDVGASIGIKNLKDMHKSIEKVLEQGAKRIKVKIKRGIEHKLLKYIREYFPNVPLMVDANSAYSLKDLDLLKSLDDYNLMMIEQPLKADDLLEHSMLQKELKTPICLDESITSLTDTKLSLKLKSCKIINLKIARVGGISEAIKIHNFCKENNIDLWGGGMLEAGVARSASIAIATLPNFSLPADTRGSSDYFKKDIIEPEIVLKDGSIKLSEKSGIGYEINRKELERVKVYEKKFTND